jgi:hypothetical protein
VTALDGSPHGLTETGASHTFGSKEQHIGSWLQTIATHIAAGTPYLSLAIHRYDPADLKIHASASLDSFEQWVNALGGDPATATTVPWGEDHQCVHWFTPDKLVEVFKLVPCGVAA